MIILLNGKFVPENRAVVSIFDRGFLYGDGLFETIRIVNGRPFRWEAHWKRLENGAKFLKIKLPMPGKKARALAEQLVVKNRMPDSLLRLALSRGIGVRGYSPKNATHPTFAMTLHPAPEIGKQPVRWKLITSSFRLPVGEPLAQFKTANKLPQILARAEADAAGADEALLLNTDGFVVEGASSNLFWIEHKTFCTPPLAAGILPGVTREIVQEICQRSKIAVREKSIRSKALKRADGIFLSLTSWGIVEAKSLDGKGLKQSPIIGRIAGRYNGWFLK
jgi:aminodeoxychorismate lyase